MKRYYLFFVTSFFIIFFCFSYGISFAEDSTGSALIIVIVDGNAFNPESVIVKVGGEVMWKNMDAAPHTVTADDGSFNSGTLGRGDEYRRKFTSPGTIKYSCDIHSFMTGTIEVRQ